ncbi:MAG: conserved membrane protein of unknown function [Promethearchaeota archaeon]|nr:MAG: conserved membrane protein of unknown function [Candidatus Lokiarchaeota archaeon]
MSLFSVYQMGFPVELVILIISPIIIVILEIILLKVGVKVTKAEKRTNLKWILASLFIQIGVITFIGLPFILMGITGQFNLGGPPLEYLIPIAIIGIIVEINLINAIHESGIGGSILIFTLFIIPMIFLVYILVTTIPSV